MTIRRLDSVFLSLWCAVCLPSLTACGARSQKVGGETSWLKDCKTNSDCGQGSCLCNVCTRACDNAADCQEVNRSVCVEPEQDLVGAACQSRSQSICLAEAQLVVSSVDASVSVDSSVDASVDSSVVVDDGIDSEASGAESSTRSVVSTTSGATPNFPESTVEVVVDTSGSPGENNSNFAGRDASSVATAGPCPQEVWDGSVVARIDGRQDQSLAGDEPGCVGECGYRYVYFGNEPRWVLIDNLSCPLDLTSCDELQAQLDDNPARCNTLDDCLGYEGTLDACDGAVYDGPTYFDSALFTPQERAQREATLSKMNNLGCGKIIGDGDDTSQYRVECIDNLCALQLYSACVDP